VLYGSETYVLTRREDKQSLLLERKVLRTISNPKIENGVFRKGTTTNSIKSVTARMPQMSRKHADCATLVTLPEDPKIYHKKLYSEPNLMEGEIKEDRNPGGRMG
jgi:hypothetical protein